MQVCFFARVADPQVLDRVEFYAQDIQILRDLGHDVRVVTRVRDLRGADLYFIWWWTWAAFPITLARVLRRPRIVTGVFDPWAFGDRPWYQRVLMKYALRHSSANVFVSQEEFAEVTANYDAPRSSHVPLTVSSDYLEAPILERERDSIFSVIWLTEGNAHRKCASELIRSIALLRTQRPSVRLAIGGEMASAMPGLRQLVSELGVEESVEFLGKLTREQKIHRLQTCTLYLQPSRYEGFGMAILEAMACGAAVVTSAVGEVPNVVGDAGAYAIGSEPDLIAAETLRLLDDGRMRGALGASARNRAQHLFSATRRLAALAAILESLH